MSDISIRLCPGCLQVAYDCTCAEGGFRGRAITADGVEVSGKDAVFWKYNPDEAFRPMSRHSAVPVNGGASEPMVEMYSTAELARLATKGNR